MVDLAEGIRRLGFRRWYERQLIESHVYFITAFLSLIVVIAGIEGYSASAGGSSRLLMVAVVVGGVVLCGWSFHRYQHMLGRAVRAAEHSKCEKCATYGAFEIVRAAEELKTGSNVTVRCRKCAHEWRMD
jgi:hypothetical protein